jgi:flagellar biosynthesis protein
MMRKREYRKKAVALKYDPKVNDAPALLAKGGGLVADQIVSIAQKNGVPIYPDGDLVEALGGLDLNIEIPDELYRAVAEVLVFIYDINKELS